MNFLKSLFLLLFFFSSANCFAQKDSSADKMVTDTGAKKVFHLIPEKHSPKFAGILSAVVPGTGQAYNKKYWKIPIVYAGAATAGYFIYRNYTIYNNFKNAYQLAADTDLLNDIHSFRVWNPTKKEIYYPYLYDQSLKAEIQDIYRKYLDYSVVAGVAVYGLNIIDAVVDAHLYDFNISDDLSLNIHPVLFNLNNYKTVSGLTFQLKF
ncbi:MAG: DUF5683 domain-containing protein [Bacteroidota bacterium]